METIKSMKMMKKMAHACVMMQTPKMNDNPLRGSMVGPNMIQTHKTTQCFYPG